MIRNRRYDTITSTGLQCHREPSIVLMSMPLSIRFSYSSDPMRHHCLICWRPPHDSYTVPLVWHGSRSAPVIHPPYQGLAHCHLHVGLCPKVLPHSGEYRASPRATLFGSPIPTNQTTKILGVTIDRGMTFCHHVAEGQRQGPLPAECDEGYVLHHQPLQGAADGPLQAVCQAGAWIRMPGLDPRPLLHPHDLPAGRSCG